MSGSMQVELGPVRRRDEARNLPPFSNKRVLLSLAVVFQQACCVLVASLCILPRHLKIALIVFPKTTHLDTI